jgi:hypothetical protein
LCVRERELVLVTIGVTKGEGNICGLCKQERNAYRRGPRGTMLFWPAIMSLVSRIVVRDLGS